MIFILSFNHIKYEPTILVFFQIALTIIIFFKQKEFFQLRALRWLK
jgi:hypothetical protein